MKRFQTVLLSCICLLLLCACHGGAALRIDAASPRPTAETDEIEIRTTEEPEPVMAIQTVQPASDPTPSSTPEPTPSSTPQTSIEPTPEPTPTPKKYVAEDGVYTVAWMSDPQHYSKKFPETYYAMTAFLRDHREELALRYVVNTGDLVNDPDDAAQWEVADSAQAMIDEIPNGVLAGNHDVLEPVGYDAFCRVFGKKRYQDRPWYGGSYQDNRGHYDLLSIGETDYLFVYMGFGPDDKAIKWVRDTFASYPDRIGILCLHDYYTKTQTLSADGKKWHDKVVKQSPNVYMVLCGHKYGSYCFPESFDDDGDGREDRTVYQLLFNYQASLHDGGGGYLRLIQIDEEKGTMRHLTYSPLLDDFNRFDDPENRETYYDFDENNEEFTLPLPWRIER